MQSSGTGTSGSDSNASSPKGNRDKPFGTCSDLYGAMITPKKHGHENITQLFDRLDSDHNGSLSPKEFKKFALEFLEVSDKQAPGLEGLIKSLFDEIDADGNGSISKQELADFLQHSAVRYQTAPVVHLVDGVAVKVLREAPSFAFESAKLHVTFKQARNVTEKEYPLKEGTAGILQTDSGYALLFTGTRVSSTTNPYEVLLLKVHHAVVTEKSGRISIKLDDTHKFKHHKHPGTPHTKCFEVKVATGLDVSKIVSATNEILNGKYNGWAPPSDWWEAQRIKTVDERLDEITAFMKQLAKENQELRREVDELRQMVGGSSVKTSSSSSLLGKKSKKK